VNKADLIRKLIAVLRELLDAGTRAARASGEAATDPDSKAENKYDTRNLEASYLARGQAFRVAEAAEALNELESLPARPFAPGQPIASGALVTLKGAEETFHCLLSPAAGGTEVDMDGTPVMVVTPSSPLGSKLKGRKAGERFEMQPGRPASSVVIESVE
jgi:transcription elongation GreA/GreB family factor